MSVPSPKSAVLCVCVVVALAAACEPPQPPRDAASQLDELPRNPVEALAELRRAPDHSASAKLAAIEILIRYQKLGWAYHHARALTLGQPENAAAWRLYYLVALSSRQDEEAMRAARRTLELGGDDARVLRHLGILSLHQRRLDEAIELLERSLQVEDAAVTHYALGRALELTGDDHAALQAYRRVEALAPDQPQLSWRQARLLARLEEGEAAYGLLSDAAARGDLPPQGLYLLATLETQLGEPERGRRLLEEYEADRVRQRQEREARERHDHAASEALDALLGDEAATALRAIEDLRQEHGEDVRLDILEAEGRARSSQLARAAELAARALEQRPRGWRYHFLYATYLEALGFGTQALQSAARAVTLQPLALEPRRLVLSIAEQLEHPALAEQQRQAIEVLEHYAPPEDPVMHPHLDGDGRDRLLAALVRGPGALAAPDEDAIPMD